MNSFRQGAAACGAGAIARLTRGDRALSRRRSCLLQHSLLLSLFVGTRAALHAAGLRFNLDLSWMFLSDLADLRERLLETVYYFHAFAPGMNIITGLILKLSPDHMATTASYVFWTSGWLLLVSLFRLFLIVGFSRWGALWLSLSFSLLPQSLFFENLYLYTHLCTALLCLAIVLFHRALQRSSTLPWLWFFLTCSALGFLYTTFHLVWFISMGFLAFALAKRGTRRRVVWAALGPGALLVTLYAKNFIVFGVFGATSWGGANLTLVTTQQMDPGLRNRWIRRGKLSPYANVTVFAPPSDYVHFFAKDLRFPWPGSNELERPSVGAGNYNHGLFLEVNRRRGEDAVYYIKQRPEAYLRVVLTENLPRLFNSSTHWHPSDRDELYSPHRAHRLVLGGYEDLYDRIVHSWPSPGVGLYVFLPPFCLWALWGAATRLRSRNDERRAVGVVLGMCLFQIVFVVSASSFFSSLESARYRYGIEPCIWVVVAMAGRTAYLRLWRTWNRWRRASAHAQSASQAHAVGEP